MDKKIYNLNFWWEKQNYGANLTAYALHKLLPGSLLVDNIIWQNAPFARKFTVFADFQRAHFHTTEPMAGDLDSLNETADTFITGSDQVFRTKYMEHPEQFLLDFAKKEARKVSFSASFGVDKDEFLAETPSELASHMGRSLASFDLVSVREKSGVEICRSLGVEAEWIIDPVFILERSEWDELADTGKADYSGKIVSYVLDTNGDYKRAYKHLARQYGTDVIETYDRNIPVEDWLRSIRDSRLFVTDSFHGVCFAIIFKKPFICIAKNARARFSSICEMLGMENQSLASVNEIYSGDCVFKLDHAKVAARIAEERARGLDFLQRALSTPPGKAEQKEEVRLSYLENRIHELQRQATLRYQCWAKLVSLFKFIKKIYILYAPLAVKDTYKKLKKKIKAITNAKSMRY